MVLQGVIHRNLNPNQRLFLQDEMRYKQRLERMSRESIDTNAGLYARKHSLEEDPILLERYDSFYHTTKSLLVLFQIMGVMPIKRNPIRPGLERTSFKWSRIFAWTIFIYCLELVIVLMVGYERVMSFLKDSENKFDTAIYNVIFLSILLPHFLLPIAAWPNGPQVAVFKNMWTKFQLKYLRVTGHPLVFTNLYVLTWVLCIASWVVSVMVILPQYFLQADFWFWHTFAYYHIIAMLNAFCSLWFVNCTAFQFASRKLAEDLQETLSQSKPAEKLMEYRHLWVDLSLMMQQLGRAYSNMYGIYCLVIFFTTIIATYGALSEIIDHGISLKELGLVLIALYCMTLLFIICNEAHHASKSVGADFQEKLLNVNLTAVDIPTQKEVEMFLVAIQKNPPQMHLNGYANINRELLTSNISFMVTYLVVLLQFKLSLLRQTVIDALRANATMTRMKMGQS